MNTTEKPAKVDLTSDDLEDLDKTPLTRADLVRIIRQAGEMQGASPLEKLLSSILVDGNRANLLRKALIQELNHATVAEMNSFKAAMEGRGK